MIGYLVFWEDFNGVETAEKVFLNKDKAIEYADKQQKIVIEKNKDKDYFCRGIEIVE